jgi:hypothetical protein
VNRDDAAIVAPLFDGHPVYGRVFASADEIDASRYDLAVACFGPSKVARRVTPGFWFHVTIRDVVREGLAPANLDPARRLGFEGPPPSHPLRLDEEGLDAVAPGYVVVHAGCDPSATYKRWPRWETVCDRLDARGVPVVVVGTEADRSPSGWEDRFDHRVGLPLPRLAALLRGARAYLGTDSGVTHLAGALGTPGLVLFGPTDPRCYAPSPSALRVLDTPPLPGEGRHPASHVFPAIDRLDLETVFSEVTRLLERPPAAPPLPTPLRRAAPRGDPGARLPTAREVAATPPTLADADSLLRETTAAAVLGWLARRDDPASLSDWRREVARAIGLAHLRAAAVRRASGTWIGYRRARNHLRQAFRAGYVVRAGIGRMRLALTPLAMLAPEPDALRH